MSPPAHLAGPPTAVAGGQHGVETQTGDQHGQQRQTQPALAQVAVSVITGTNVIICKVFILVMTVVEKTLGTGKARHALDPLLQHVGSVPT